MSEPEVHPQSAVHEQPDVEASHAQAWRAHTRGTLPDELATVIDLTQRSRARIGERWGKPIEEPPDDTPTDDPDDAGPRWRDLLAHVRVFRASPSLRAIAADLKEGGTRAYQTGGVPAAGLYWVFGVPGFALCVFGEKCKFIGARPGRHAAAWLIALLAWGALIIAGLNPLPIP